MRNERDVRFTIVDFQIKGLGDLRFVICNLRSIFLHPQHEKENERRGTEEENQTIALRVMKLVGVLPKTIEGRAIGNQLIRSGTSIGANYLPC